MNSPDRGRATILDPWYWIHILLCLPAILAASWLIGELWTASRPDASTRVVAGIAAFVFGFVAGLIAKDAIPWYRRTLGRMLGREV